MDQSQFLLDKFLPEHLGTPGQSVEFIVAKKIKDAHSDMQHIVILDLKFPLAPYLKAENIDVKVTDAHRVHYFDNFANNLVSTLKTGLSKFTWKGTDFIVYKVTWCDAVVGMQVIYIVLFRADGKDKAERDKVGEELITAAYRWDLALKEEIYVYSDGHWSKDEKLWQAIQIAEWDNLILQDEFVAGLKRDTATFFSSRKIYDALDIPWKRGLLLLGIVAVSILNR